MINVKIKINSTTVGRNFGKYLEYFLLLHILNVTIDLFTTWILVRVKNENLQIISDKQKHVLLNFVEFCQTLWKEV